MIVKTLPSSSLRLHSMLATHATRIVPSLHLLHEVMFMCFATSVEDTFIGLSRLTVCLNKNLVYPNRNIKFLWTNLNFQSNQSDSIIPRKQMYSVCFDSLEDKETLTPVQDKKLPSAT